MTNMQTDVPWNVAGIPPEAREAARAAARREGLSVGEWLTRRILRGLSEVTEELSTRRSAPNGVAHAESAQREIYPNPETSRRETDELLAKVSRSEAEATNAYRRIEEQLRAVAWRLDSNERSQVENNRAMSKAAEEINVATREQAHAFDQLGSSVVGLVERLERVERNASGEAMRDAVKGLHQGLSRLADQIAQTAKQSATQIASLADNLETMAGKVGQAKLEAEALSRTLDARIAQTGERLRAVERSTQMAAQSLERADGNTAKLGRLEESIAQLESRVDSRGRDAALDDRLASIEHALRDISARSPVVSRLEETVATLEARGNDASLERRLKGIEITLSGLGERLDASDRTQSANPIDETVRVLADRIKATEKRHGEALSELREAVDSAANRLAAVETVPHPVTGGGTNSAFAPSAPPMFDAPPFAEQPTAPLAEPSAPTAFADLASPPFSAARLPPAEAPVPNTDDHASPADDDKRVPERPSDVPPAPAGDSFLAAARRSAQAAAAQAEAERGARAIGGFAWGSGIAAAQTTERPKTRHALVGVLAFLIVLVIAAGVLLSQRLPAPDRASGLAALLMPANPASSQHAAVHTRVALKLAPHPAPPVAPASPTVASPAQAAVPSPPAATPSSPAAPPAQPAVHAKMLPPGPQASLTAEPKPAPSQPPLNDLARLSELAAQGNAKAETVLGIKYLDAEGVPMNEGEAVKWLERASQKGEPVAEYRLGTLFERGRGVMADPSKAVHWYLAAAQAGNRKAMHNLAVAYAQGTGTGKDFAEAARWFAKAAELGLADSQFNLAVLYERGLGVPQSLIDAYKWYAIAAQQGDSESKARLDALSTQLSADDKAAAQRSADLFRPGLLDRNANIAPEPRELQG